jgi:hypothetical protein
MLADQAAEPVPAENPDVYPRDGWMRMPGRRALPQCPVRPVSVVAIDVLAGNEPEMPFAGDQHPVQALAAALAIHLSAIAFAQGARTGVLMIRTPAAVSTASNAAVNLASRSRIRNFKPVNPVFEVHQRVAGLLGHPLPRGMSGDAGQVHAPGAVLDEEQHVEAAQNTVSTWKKLAARIVLAWASRNARQVCPDRRVRGRCPRP